MSEEEKRSAYLSFLSVQPWQVETLKRHRFYAVNNQDSWSLSMVDYLLGRNA